MKKIAIIGLIVVFILVLLAYAKLNNRGQKIKTTAHRGFSYEYPENTLLAVEKASESGFSFCEVDIRKTKDNEWVLMHDETVDKTTNGTGKVSELTLEYIKSLDAGSWKHSDFAGLTVPTLSEYLQICSHERITPVIEIKGIYSKDEIEELVDLIGEYFNLQDVIVISFEFDYLDFIRDYTNKIRLGYIVWEINESAVVHVKNAGNSYISTTFETITKENVALCNENDIEINVWTVNDIEIFDSMVDEYGITNITTDVFPDVLRE